MYFHKLEEHLTHYLNNLDLVKPQKKAVLAEWLRTVFNKNTIRISCPDFLDFPEYRDYQCLKAPYPNTIIEYPRQDKVQFTTYVIIKPIEAETSDRIEYRKQSFRPCLMLEILLYEYSDQYLWHEKGNNVVVGYNTKTLEPIFYAENPAIDSQHENIIALFSSVVLNTLGLLHAENIPLEKITIKPKFNRKREKRGKTSIKPYSILKLPKPPKNQYIHSNNLGSTKSRHWRKAHLRRLADNRLVWVKASLINKDNPNRSNSTKIIRT